MITVEIGGTLTELLPQPEMVQAAEWLVEHGCPELASALWREGEELGDVTAELDSIPGDAPEAVRQLKALVLEALGGT